MSETLRYLILYDIVGGDDFSKEAAFLIELVEQSGAKPNKITVTSSQQEKSRSIRVTKKRSAVEIIPGLGVYDSITLDETVNNSYMNVRSHINFSLSNEEYYIARRVADFSMDLAYEHLTLICHRITPRYGFVNVQESSEALFHPFGTSTTSADSVTGQRVWDLGRSRRTTKEHRSGKIHDVYPLNVLNDTHLERDIDGITLKNWINVGDRGELRTIKDGVHAWIVPDDKRAVIRDILFKAGALFASV